MSGSKAAKGRRANGLLCLVLPLLILGASAAEVAYVPSFRYNGFYYLNDTGLLAKARLEYNYDNFPYVPTGNIQITRTTGLPYTDIEDLPYLLGEEIYETVERPEGYLEVREVGFSNSGTVLLELFNYGSPATPGGGLSVTKTTTAVYKDGAITILSSAGQFNNPVGINATGWVCATKTYPYGHEAPGTEVPVLISPSGTLTQIPRPDGEAYGRELFDDRPRRSNEGWAIAINASGAVLCAASRWYQDQFSVGHVHSCFIYRNGAFLAQNLRPEAMDMNDHGEVVGSDSGGVWIYLPSAKYGLSAGSHTISTTRGEVKISNNGTVTRTSGSPSAPVLDVWIRGTWHSLASLLSTSEIFTVRSIEDLNASGQILVETLESSGSRATRILTPVEEEPTAVVNSVDDDPIAANAVLAETGEFLANGNPEVTLRSAIQAANLGRVTRITFNIPANGLPANGIPRISPLTDLPEVNAAVTLDGTTQAGDWVEVRGNANLNHGISLKGGGAELRGFILNGFSKTNASTVLISGGTGNRVVGNRIGVDATGQTAGGDRFGVVITNSAGNRIGGGTEADRNLIYGSANAIAIGEAAGANDNQILGNHINLTSDGAIMNGNSGIFVSGGTGLKIGGEAAGEKNHIGVSEDGYGVIVVPTHPVGGVEITGNQIGMNRAGTQGSGGRFGIALLGLEGSTIPNVKIQKNTVAACRDAIWLARCPGAIVEENAVGYSAAAPTQLPGGINPLDLNQGIRLDRCADARIVKNTVGWHRYNILVAGDVMFTGSYATGNLSIGFLYPTGVTQPHDEVVSDKLLIEDNQVGSSGGVAPSNAAVQKTGIAVFQKVGNAVIRNNRVVAHGDYQIQVMGGKGHSLRGNSVGVIGSQGFQSKAGIAVHSADDVRVGSISEPNKIGFLELTAIVIDGKSRRTLVEGNLIGVPVGLGEPQPNQNGIVVLGDETDKPTDTVIRANEIGGSVNGTGILLQTAGTTRVEENFIGVTRSGQSFPNNRGIAIASTPSFIENNAISGNLEYGIVILSHNADAKVLMAGNAIYNNGGPTDASQRGIHYVTNPIPAPGALVTMQSLRPVNGKFVFFFVVPSYNTNLPVVLEVFGNAANDAFPQGRYSLVRQGVFGGAPGLIKFEAPLEAVAGRTFHFRVTATIDGATSAFSEFTQSIPFEVPELRFGPPEEDSVALFWEASDLFVPQVKFSLDEDWQDIGEPIQTGNGVKSVVYPFTDAPSHFFQLRVDSQALLNAIE